METVVGRAVFILYAYAGFHYGIFAIAFGNEHLDNLILGAVGWVAEPETLDGLLRETARLRVVGESHVSSSGSVE